MHRPCACRLPPLQPLRNQREAYRTSPLRTFPLHLHQRRQHAGVLSAHGREMMTLTAAASGCAHPAPTIELEVWPPSPALGLGKLCQREPAQCSSRACGLPSMSSGWLVGMSSPLREQTASPRQASSFPKPPGQKVAQPHAPFFHFWNGESGHHADRPTLPHAVRNASRRESRPCVGLCSPPMSSSTTRFTGDLGRLPALAS